MKKKMNIRESRLFVSAAKLYATRSDNLREDGSVNWDWVSADLHIINDIGRFRDVDIEIVLITAERSLVADSSLVAQALSV